MCRDPKDFDRWTSAQKLAQNGQGPYNCALEYRYIMWPLHHVSIKHWSCGVVDTHAKQILHFDSMAVSPCNACCAVYPPSCTWYDVKASHMQLCVRCIV